MAKRVSLKGKGADIFFGEGVRAPATTPEPSPESTHDSTEVTATDLAPRTVRTTDRSNDRTHATAKRTKSLRPDERPFERTNERFVVRHSFDVRQDQLLALADIQTEVFRTMRRKPKLGELVQQALDDYIQRYRRRTNGRSNERMTE